MKSEHAQIEGLGIELLIGESLNRQVCPWCLSADKSFSITRTETGLLYNCYRDTCRQQYKSHGFLGTSGVHQFGKAEHKSKPTVGRPYIGDLRDLTNDELNELWKRYVLDDLVLGSVQFGDHLQRYMIPVLNPHGLCRGYAARTTPTSSARPKMLAYPDRFDRPWIGWYRTPFNKTLVLVEDHWSAMRVVQDMRYLDSVALMGTHLSLDAAMEIGTIKPDKIIIALDKDATASAYTMRRKYSLFWNCRCEVLPLDKDLKDLTADELKHKLADV